MKKLLLFILCLAPTLQAKITVSNGYFKAYKGARNGSAYCTFNNDTAAADTLESVDIVDEDIAEHTELHTHIHLPHPEVPGAHIMRMEKIETLDLPKGETKLKPGGLHIMLMKLKPEIFEKKTIKLRLNFKCSPSQVITVNRKTL